MTAAKHREQVIADLRAARTELVTRGRCIGELVSHDGRVCAYGALGVAVIPGFEELSGVQREAAVDYSERISRAGECLEQHIPSRGYVSSFNDRSSTTDQDVLDLFDKALADLGGLA